MIGNILVINSGSSSIKFKLFNDNLEILCDGLIERIGLANSLIKLEYNENKDILEVDIKNHQSGLEHLFNLLMEKAIITDLNTIKFVGHRVVHGGEIFNKATIVTDEVLEEIEQLATLAPLHNGVNALGIKVVKKLLPNAINIAVFDTAFHQTMEPIEYIYPIKYDYYKNLKVRRYGMHGISHQYCMQVISDFYQNNNLRIINCHLGAGASICAIKNNQSIATTMGFTPLAGLMMATRCGDIDPAIAQYLAHQLNLSIDEIINIFNKESGLLGVSKISGDIRDVKAAANNGDVQAQLALDLFVKRIVEEISKYIVKLNGVDVICFTAGIGENDKYIQKEVIKQLEIFGVEIADYYKKDQLTEIHTQDSKIKVVIVKTMEELEIAKQIKEISLKMI